MPAGGLCVKKLTHSHVPLCAYRLPRGAAVAGRGAGRMFAGIDGEVRPIKGATLAGRGAAWG